MNKDQIEEIKEKIRNKVAKKDIQIQYGLGLNIVNKILRDEYKLHHLYDYPEISKANVERLIELQVPKSKIAKFYGTNVYNLRNILSTGTLNRTGTRGRRRALRRN